VQTLGRGSVDDAAAARRTGFATDTVKGRLGRPPVAGSSRREANVLSMMVEEGGHRDDPRISRNKSH